MDELLRFNGQLYKRVDGAETGPEIKADRFHDGNPENSKELSADLDKCKKAEILLKKLEADLDALEYDLSSLAIASRGLTETKAGFSLIKKELEHRKAELNKMKF